MAARLWAWSLAIVLGVPALVGCEPSVPREDLGKVVFKLPKPPQPKAEEKGQSCAQQPGQQQPVPGKDGSPGTGPFFGQTALRWPASRWPKTWTCPLPAPPTPDHPTGGLLCRRGGLP